MFRSTPSPVSSRTVNPPSPLPASSGPSQTHRTPTSHSATPLKEWRELLANGTGPGQQGPVLISEAAFPAGSLKKPLPISLDHEWMGRQRGKLSEDGDALLRSFVMAFKHGSPAAGNTFAIQKIPSAVKIGFTHEGQQYYAQCRLRSDGNISHIELSSTETPPRKLSLTREGDIRTGDPAYFPSQRRERSESPLHRQLLTEAKRLKLEQDADGQLSPEIRAAYEVLRLAPEGESIDGAGLASVLMVGGKKQLAALKVLKDAGEIDLEPENEHDTSVLSELLEHLAQPRRPDFSHYTETLEGDGIPTDRDRLALVIDMDPFRGCCSNGQSPIDFARDNGLTEAIELFAASRNPEIQRKLATWQLANLERESFGSLRDNPEYRQHLNRFVKTAAYWDKDIVVPLFHELISHTKHIGAHFFDDIVEAMHAQKWEHATQTEFLKKFVYQYGCLTTTDSTTTRRMYEAIFELAENVDLESKASLFSGLATHINQLVPVHPQSLNCLQFQYHAEESSMPDPYQHSRTWFSTIFEQIKNWRPDQQSPILERLAWGIKSIDYHCAKGDKRAETLEIDVLDSIRQRVKNWTEEERKHANANAVISAAQPNRYRGITWGERR